MLDRLQIDPIAFTIPIGDGFPIYWYGILVTLGIILGVLWATRELAKRGEGPDDLFTGLFIVIIAGYLSARLWYVLQEVVAGRGGQYDTFLEVINVRAGGVNILGGFIGAALAGYIFVKFRRLSFWRYADVAGPTLLIAQAIGRWGNFINQELHGPPTELPWGILIERPVAPFNDIIQYPAGTRFHPTFLYESLWLLLGFILLTSLINVYRKSWKEGTLFGIFLIWWGGGRAWIEFFRPDQPTFGNSSITYSMVIALLLAIVGVLVILNRYGRFSISSGRRRRKRRVLKPKPRRETSGE